MAKGKILVFLRVSTEAQELDAQRNEMRDFVKSMGYSDVIYVEGKGASAIKINDEYISMYEEVKSYIERKEISAVAVWHVNRLARDEEWFVKFKKLFIENKIQFIIKNPTLCLLNEDGSVNAGSELALSLFSTMSSQDMEEKKAKFKRAKAERARKGMYNGGSKVLKFGYKVNENKYFVEDEEESKIVKLIFQLYSTGEYSTYSLAKEINSRGYTHNGKPFDGTFVGNVLKSQQYTGAPDKKWNDRVYPPIISEEIFNQCRKIADKNKIMLRQGKKMVLCSRLMKCTECGHAFVSAAKHFRCNGTDKGVCTNNITLKEYIVDMVAWKVAFDAHAEYLVEVSENNVQTYNARLEVIAQKINTINGIISESDAKKKRILDTYLEGYIDKKERDLRLKKIQDDTLSHHKQLKALEEEKKAILTLLENASQEKSKWVYFNALDTIVSSVKSDEDRYRIIHQHILKIIPYRYQHGEKSKKAKKENGILLEIYTVKGEVKKFIYLPKEQKGDNLLTYHDDKGIWLGERL